MRQGTRRKAGEGDERDKMKEKRGRQKGTSPGRAMARGKAEDGAHAEDQRTRERQGKKRNMDGQDEQDEGGKGRRVARDES